MSRLLFAIDGRTSKSRSPRVWKIGAATAVALATMSAAVWFGQVSPARAEGVTEQAPANKQAGLPADLARFVTEIDRRLRGCHERIVDLAKPLMESLSARNSTQSELLNQQITVSSAKGNFGNATLNREVAEIAVVEYEEGIFKRDQAMILGEIKLAESDVLRAKDTIEVMKTRLAKIKEVSKGSAAEVALEYQYEDKIADAERREPTARLALEQAESKLKILQEHAKPKTVKDLKSAVEKDRADELSKKATWESETAKLNRIQAASRNKVASASTKARSASLERVFSVDEKIRGQIAELMKTGKLDDGGRKVLLDLTNELEGAVEHVEAEQAAAQVDRVKAAIHAAAGRAEVVAPKGDAKLQPSVPADVTGFVSEFTRRLKTNHARIVRLASQVLETINGKLPLESGPVSQQTRIEAAKASLKTAQLAREVAELELKKHSKENGEREESTYQRELVMAQDDLKRAMKARAKAIERLEKIKGLVNGSATDLQLEYQF